MIRLILLLVLLVLGAYGAAAEVELSFSALQFSRILKGESDILTFGVTNTGNETEDVRVVIADRGNPLKYQPGNFHFGGSNPIEDSVLMITLSPGESRTGIPIYFFGQSYGVKEALVKVMYSGPEKVGLIYGEVERLSDRSWLKPGERVVDFFRVTKGVVQYKTVLFTNSTNKPMNVFNYEKAKVYPEIFSIATNNETEVPMMVKPGGKLELSVRCVMDFYGEVHDTITILSESEEHKTTSENYIILSASCYDEGAQFKLSFMEDLSQTMYVNKVGDSVARTFVIENVGVKAGTYAVELSNGEFFSVDGDARVDTTILKPNESDTITVQYTSVREERVEDFLNLYLSNPIPGQQAYSTLQGIVLNMDTVYLKVENSVQTISDTHQVVVRLQSVLSKNAKKIKLDFQFNQKESKPAFSYHVLSTTGDIIFATAHLVIEENIVGEPLVRLAFEHFDQQNNQFYFFANTAEWYDIFGAKLPIPTVIIHPTASASNIEVSTEPLQLHVYPNPANHTVHVQLSYVADQTVLDCYDASGALQFHENLTPNNQSIQLNVGGLASGVYTLRVRSGLGTVACTFIKQ